MWTTEPSLHVIEKLSTKHLGIESNNENACTVEFFAQGAYNKLYVVTCRKGEFVFRVTLPVAPQVKTLSEVATLSFVREKTSIPVPKVIAFDADLKNELGFEWILMERLDGQPLREKWHEISWLKKGLLVQQVADFVAQLARLELPGIGSIYTSDNITSNGVSPPPASDYQIGEAVQPAFFLEDHIQLPIARGPFPNSHAFVAAHMQHVVHDVTLQLTSTDSDEQEDGAEMQHLFTQLEPLIPQLFPPSTTNEPSYLFHADLSTNNILVNSAGDLVGIVDWESLIAAPSWLSCQLPQFLDVLDVPITECPDPLPAEYADDPDAVEGYEEVQFDYETAQLRRFFLEEMARLEPRWVETFRRESTRRDVLLAIELVGLAMQPNLVKGWIEAVGEGRELKCTLTEALRKD